MTQGERLARIEALLETGLKANSEQAQAALEKLEEMDRKWTARFEALEADHRQDVANLDELKNKGRGILIGVGLAGSALGAVAMASFERLLELFK